MIDDETSYFRLRAAEEVRMAEKAKCPEAEAAHWKMALRYAEKANLVDTKLNTLLLEHGDNAALYAQARAQAARDLGLEADAREWHQIFHDLEVLRKTDSEIFSGNDKPTTGRV
ncbi:hypothetical protein GCM10022281_05000 [Sphingomonas rosea]|jgi:hypothetical protein|uniref:DUF4398 domain-containing protein n=1 Tax=Sphingomonas rosea TaxID=335605 RepID=A0ABP7TNH5_9SPHN